jgi:hypothetical protein
MTTLFISDTTGKTIQQEYVSNYLRQTQYTFKDDAHFGGRGDIKRAFALVIGNTVVDLVLGQE